MDGTERLTQPSSEDIAEWVSRRTALRLAGLTMAAGASAYALEAARSPDMATAQVVKRAAQPATAAQPASNVYVIVNASGGGDYTDLEQAVQSVGPNTTVLVKTGLYTIQVGNMRPATGVRIIGEGYGTHIQAKNGLNANLFILQYDNIVVENLRIDGNGANQNLASGNCIYIDNVQHCRVVNCWVHDSPGYNVVLFPGATQCVVMGNHVYNGREMGIELQGASYCSVVGNTVAGMGESGIFVWNSSGDCNSNAITGNTVQGCGDCGIMLEDGTHDNTVTGNTCLSNGRFGIGVAGTQNNTVGGNIVRFSGSDGIHVEDSSSVVVGDNVVANSGRIGIYIRTSPGCAVAGNVLKGNKWSGIEFASGSSSAIPGSACSGNVCVGNGSGAVSGQQFGIHVRQGLGGVPITGNLCYDGGSGTQLYGIGITDSAAGEVLLQGNALGGNVQSGLFVPSGTNVATTPERVLRVSVGASQASIPHGLPYTPLTTLISMTSSGAIWRSASSDATNIYLTADGPNRSADVAVG